MDNKGRLIVFSGAGISADSGISTFRDNGGLWEDYDPMVVANFSTWKEKYDLVHRFYNQRRADLEFKEPNEAHKIVAEWEKDFEVVNLTQNIDDLFEKAGCENVVHLHGKLDEMKCYGCGKIWNIGYEQYDPKIEQCSCGCKKAVKPNVIFFGEIAPEYAALHTVVKSLTEKDIFIVIGTSNQVIDIQGMIVWNPCYKIWVNTEKPLLIYNEDIYNEKFIGNASDVMKDVDRHVRVIYDRKNNG